MTLSEQEREEIEKFFVKEREAKERYIDRCNELERKAFESQAELVQNRLKVQKFDNEKKEMERVIRDLGYQVEDTREAFDRELEHLKSKLVDKENEIWTYKNALSAYE